MAEGGSKSLPGRTLDQRLEALPISAASLGALAATGLLLLFAGSELLLGRHRLLMDAPDPAAALRDARDARVAIFHILLAVYVPLATLVVRSRTRAQLLALSRTPGAGSIAELAGQVGRAGPVATWLARALGIGAMVAVTYLSTPREYWSLIWDLGAMDPEPRWHRILGLWIGWWIGEFSLTMFAESARMTRSAERLGPLDLLDPAAREPYTRHALALLLASVGLGGIVSLFLFERGYGATVALVWAVSLGVGVAAMWVSLHGIHLRIRDTKAAELSRCRTLLRRARASLDEGQSPEPPLSDLVAWESRIEAVREWPFDSGALARIGLYGLIPLMSWLGGALVERGVDSLLD